MIRTLCFAIPFLAVLSSAQTVQDDPNLVYRPPMHYPDRTLSGTVTVEAKLGPDGRVTEARASSGPEALRNAVVENLLQWRYVPGSARSVVSVTFVTHRIGGFAAFAKLKSQDPEYPAVA